MPISTGTRFGAFEILSPIGEGGMGEVYRGRDTNLGRDVAIKVLPDLLANDAEYIARFQREAHVLASMNHPNIAAIYGLEGRAIVMELVEGPTLADRIAQGPVPLDEALPIARQIIEALEYAHEKNIIHRDLKPANVKVTPDGVVKVLDFGLAKIAETQALASQSNPATSPTLTVRAATQAGLILGTAAYMAPEQARGHAVDKRADIWALGAVMFEMLSGKMAFAGDNVTDILASVVKLEPEWAELPRSTPPVVRTLITCCLTKDRKRRLQAIGDARLMLDGDLAPAPAEAVPKPPGRRSLALLLYAAIATASLLALAIVHVRETPPAEQVLRYSIPLPDKSQLHTFAASPDGRYLAIAAWVDGRRKLYLRPLDALTTQELKGTDGASYPFWSPDSRSVGFFAGGKLKRIGVDGSPPLNLCDARAGRGGTWNHDGVIVFAPSNDGVLMRVAAGGGVPVAVSKAAKGEIHRFPVFLPDGNRFLYASNLGPEGGAGLYVAALDGRPAKRVLTDQSSALWHGAGRNGYLFFHRNGTLMAQPTDTSSLQPAGDVFPVAEQLSIVNLHYLNASVTSNGLLVYSSGASTADQQLRWHDRSGKVIGEIGTPSKIVGLALSPDDKSLAVARGGLIESDIWLHDLVRGTETRFTFDAAGSRAPVWSPDSRRLAYTSSRSGYAKLYIKETSGSGQDQALLPNAAIQRAPSDWSADGRTLLFTEGLTNRGLWTLGLDGGQTPKQFTVTPFSETQGQFSPDRKWVAYKSDESGRDEIYVRPFPTGAGKWKISVDGGDLPRWRGDGKEIFFVSSKRALMSVTISVVNTASLSVGIPQPLLDATTLIRPLSSSDYSYAVSADGKRFLVSHTLGEPQSLVTVVVNWLAAVKK